MGTALALELARTFATSDIDRLPRYDMPPDVSPLDLLLADREDDER
ncbi:hypothetical protein ACQP0I_31225 [Micromonospora carbonacea]